MKEIDVKNDELFKEANKIQRNQFELIYQMGSMFLSAVNLAKQNAKNINLLDSVKSKLAKRYKLKGKESNINYGKQIIEVKEN